mgnify:CR=1 FL=1
MRINTNLSAMTALNNSTKTTALASSSMEKLSSGLKINKAGDDAAGLAISEKMRSQIRGLDQASQNTQDGISVVQTAEGAMEETGNILQRMRELTVQAANETNTVEDRAKITEELTQLTSEIDRIANSTEFNGKKILNGGGTMISNADLTANGTGISEIKVSNSSLSAGDTLEITSATDGELVATITKADGSGTITQTLTGIKSNANEQEISFTDLGISIRLQGTPGEAGANDIVADTVQLTASDLADGNTNSITIQAGANSGNDVNQTITVNLSKTDSATLGFSTTDIDDIKDADLTTGTQAANDFISKLDDALKTVNTSRANLGATQNRLETAQSNLTTSSENLTAAESRIRDVDVAAEMMNLSKLNLINQAAQAMMTQAKSQPEGVMQLLR